jgi:hypothetical protein
MGFKEFAAKIAAKTPEGVVMKKLGALKTGASNWNANRQANKQQTTAIRTTSRNFYRDQRQQKRAARSAVRAQGEWGVKFLLIMISFGSLILQNFLPDLFKLILLVVACFLILLLANKAVIVWPWGVIIVVIIIVLFWFSHFYGDLAFYELERSGVLPEAEKELENMGIEHQFSVIGQILTGDFEPEQLWTSEAVQSEYAVPEEFEFFLADVASRKEAFKPEENIYVVGNVNLISGFDKTTTVTLGVEPKDFCSKDSEKYWEEIMDEYPAAKGIAEFFKLTDADPKDVAKLKGCSDGTPWECYITGSTEMNTFHMDRIYNRLFYCNHTGIDVKDDEVISSLAVTWEYSTSSVAGMQVYVFNTKTLGRNPGNPIERYGIAEDSLTSWYIGDERVNLGLGLSGTNNKYVRAETGEDLFDDINYLAISVQNKGGGKVTEIESLSVSFPNTPEISVASHIAKVDESEITFIGPTTEVITILGSDVVTKKFTLSDSERTSFDTRGPSESITYYIPFVVSEDYVGGTDFRSFLVKADIRYKYKDSEPVPVAIKP